jgi:hypothetical protein
MYLPNSEHILVPDPMEEGSNAGGESLLGKWAFVRIVGVSKFFMRSQLLSWSKCLPRENGGLEEKCCVTTDACDSSPSAKHFNAAADYPSAEVQKAGDLSLIRWAIVGLVLLFVFKLLFAPFNFPKL